MKPKGVFFIYSLIHFYRPVRPVCPESLDSLGDDEQDDAGRSGRSVVGLTIIYRTTPIRCRIGFAR